MIFYPWLCYPKGARKTEVVIDLNSRIVTEDTDTVSINTLGEMKWEDGACQLLYETRDEDGTVCATRIIVEDDTVSVSQQGSTRSLLSIREGNRSLSQYQTAYGALAVGVTGHRVRSSLTPDGGSLLLEYDVDINASAVSKNIIEIYVRRVSNDV